MKKNLIYLLFVSLVLLLSSCPQVDTFDNEKLNELRSKSISLPLWCDCAVSPWISWQSEQGQKLHEYVLDSVISDKFEGNFRIIYNESDLGICFNDEEGTLVDLIFLCEQKNTSSDSDESLIEFDCTAKKTLYEESTKSNKSHVVIKKISDNLFRFNLSVNGKELIDSDVKKVDTENKMLVKRPNWLKKVICTSDFSRDFWYMADFYLCDQAYSLITIDQPFFNLTCPNVSKNFTFSYEGVSIRNQDDKNHILSINFLDGNLGGNSDYVEIKMRDDKVRIDNGVIDEYDSVDITFYKIIDGTLSIVKKYENLICYD